jgi:hypothetical protein
MIMIGSIGGVAHRCQAHANRMSKSRQKSRQKLGNPPFPREVADAIPGRAAHHAAELTPQKGVAEEFVVKHLVAAAVVALSVLAINACGTDVDLGSRPAYTTGSNTLTLFVYDGQSGAAIEDAKVTVQIGAAVEQAAVTNNTYTITGIPGGTFPVTVARDGYLTFTSATTFAAGTSITSPSTVPGTNVFSVGMFPVQSVTTDITIKVYDQSTGAPINNGEIVAILDSTKTIAGNAGVGATVGGVKPLAGSIGFLPSSVTASITSGTATLPHDKLVFGATYTLFVVSATNAAGQFVSGPASLTAVAGQTSGNQLVIFASGPNVTPVALSANNEDSHVSTPSLDVTFPYPVVTCSDHSTWSWSNITGGATTEKAPTTGDKVQITFPSTTVMRIAPIIDPAFVTSGDVISVTFSSISVKVSGSATCTPLTSVSIRGSATNVSATINLPAQ